MSQIRDRIDQRRRTRRQARRIVSTCLKTYAAGLKHHDTLQLGHEAERLDSLPPSPAVRRMRRLVDDELVRRFACVLAGGAR